MHTLANPKANYVEHRDAIDKAIREVMESGVYILGPKVRVFEQHFADYLGVADCVGVANGTDAIQLALRAIGVRSGDTVITTTHTAVATVAAVDWIGATPLLLDIDPITYTIDPQKVEDTMRRMPAGSVKALIAVHLYGHPADMTALIWIAERFGLALVEDCAQAHGAAIDKQKVGAIGACGAFSFYPTKNLGAFGDGGAIVSNDSEIVERLRLLRQYGWRERYISDEVGSNSRLDELQAAILDCKLGWLDSWNLRRREIAAQYNRGLTDLPLEQPIEQPGYYHVYHQYVIRSADQSGLRSYLEKQGVMTGILYPKAVHQQPAYRGRVKIGEGGMHVTERIVQEILCLPIYPELSDRAVADVINHIRSYFGDP